MWYTTLVRKKLQPFLPPSAPSPVLRNQGKRVPAIFYRTEAGGEPVKTVEFGWPIGMPVCKPLGHAVYEVRTSLAQNRVAECSSYIDKKSRMVLLHGFIKKTQKTPDEDMALARGNKGKHQGGLQ
jgi:hypothetical protein